MNRTLEDALRDRLITEQARLMGISVQRDSQRHEDREGVLLSLRSDLVSARAVIEECLDAKGMDEINDALITAAEWLEAHPGV